MFYTTDCSLRLPFGVLVILLLSFPLLLVFVLFYFVVGSTSLFYLYTFLFSRVATSPIFCIFLESRDSFWPHSPLWVWVAAVFLSPDPVHSSSMSGIHWVEWWWWWWIIFLKIIFKINYFTKWSWNHLITWFWEFFPCFSCILIFADQSRGDHGVSSPWKLTVISS